jgi:hypothetical protein
MPRGIFRVTTVAALGFAVAACQADLTDSGPESPAQPRLSVSGTAAQAAQADSFVSSVGVNTHLFFNNVYRSGYASIVKPRLAELGVRHLREHALPATDGNAGLIQARLRELAAQGTRTLATIDKPYCTLISSCLSWIKATGAGSVVEAVEGPNEPDIRYSARGTTWTWMPAMKQYMADLWKQAHADPSLARLPVGSPSFWMPQTPTYLGDVSDRVAFGSIHPYPAWPQPPVAYDAYAVHRQRFTPDYRQVPFWATETGYHTGGAGSDRPVSEVVHGKYIPRLLLEYFNRGASRSYLYELVDEGTPSSNRENSFGLVRNNGTPKPAFTALKNLLGLLADPGPGFVPGRLSYTLSGDLTAVHTTLLQRRNGTFYLALWLEVPSTDALQTRSLTLSFPVAHDGAMYVPNQQRNAVKSFQGASVALSVADRVTVLEIR